MKKRKEESYLSYAGSETPQRGERGRKMEQRKF
jgi:hypothetical protein